MIKALSVFGTALMLCALAPISASAQPARTFVASIGNDANVCSIAAPCRTMQRGINAVASGGDVLILDSGGFGADVMITKSVSVYAAPGAQARITSSEFGFGIRVNGNGIVVALSGFGISAPLGSGIYFESGASISIHDMDISGGPSSISVLHQAPDGHITMSNSKMRTASFCFYTNGLSSAPARATVMNTLAENCVQGYRAADDSVIAISSSQISGDFGTCFGGFVSGGSGAIVTLDNVVATGCTHGIRSVAAGVITVSNALLTGNTNAGIADGGTGRTFGSNRIFGNTSNMLTNFTAIAEQ